MTIGIAAKGPGFIVTVTDRRQLMRDLMGVDDAGGKAFRIDGSWGFLFAGDDLNLVHEIAEKAIDYARVKPGNRKLREIQECVCLAYQRTRQDEINTRYVKPFGYHDLAELRQKITKELGERLATDAMHDITAYDLGIELLVYGFDEQGIARTLLVDNPGAARLQEATNYWAIGSGFDFAMTVLNTKMSLRSTVPDEQTYIYHLCEAKFAAEWDPAVGKPTAITIWYPDGFFSFINDDDIEEIRLIAEKERHQPIPQTANQLLGKRISEQRGLHRAIAGQKASSSQGASDGGQPEVPGDAGQ